MTQIASLSGTDPRIITDKIKFLFPPDLVFATDASGTYTAVLLGSGDREHPFDATVQNSFFMIKDRDASALVGAPNNTTVSIARPTPDTSSAWSSGRVRRSTSSCIRSSRRVPGTRSPSPNASA